MIWTARVRFAGPGEEREIGFDDDSMIPESLNHALMALRKRRNRSFVLGWWVREQEDEKWDIGE